MVSLVGLVETRAQTLEDSIQKLESEGEMAGKFSERVDALELLVNAHQS